MTSKSNHKRRKLTLTTPNTPLSQSDYTFALTQIAVSQICQSIGFTTTTHSTLKTLTHITTLFLQTLAKYAVSYSNHSNRSQPNLIDIVQALHDLAGVDGFVGASVSHQTQNPFCSKVVKDLSFFVSWSKEIPFARAVLKRSGNENMVMAGLASGSRRGMHIPEWLPGFPDANGEKNGSGVSELARWERSSSVVECGCGGDGVKSGGYGGGDLGKERGVVRFRIRVQRRSTVRIGGFK